MASISSDKQGRRTIQFVGADGRRRSIRLGKISKQAADGVKSKLEALNAARISQQPLDNATAHWVADLDDVLIEKLAAVGLLARRASAMLKQFLDDYVAMRVDVKSSTATVYGHTRRCLIEFFGADKPLREIRPGDADEWRLWLIEHEKLADNTVRRRSGIARQFFKAALRKQLIRANPFADLVSVVRGNASRYFFVTEAMAQRVLDACPDSQWRLLFALSRYGGLRCPSEHLGLRWSDVDWELGRLTIRSPKTEHHEGKERRQIPIFPQLRPYLQDVRDQADDGAFWVITGYRDANANLRTQLQRIIRKAGLEPWPKLFQNLRSTRETELAESFPMHVVCSWIGNSRAVAAQHYLQVTDEHFQQAADGARSALHNPVQSGAESTRKEPQQESETPVKHDVLCVSRGYQVGVTGLEPVTSTV
jgi:integrase